MRDVKSVTITLADGAGVYAPGDKIEGEIVVVTGCTVSIQSLALVLRGIARVHWTDSENAGLRLTPYSQHVYSSVDYARETTDIVSPRNGQAEVVLTEGHHTFPFGVTLPSRCLPTSFEGKHGSIIYWLRAEVLQSGRTKRCSTKPVQVMNPTDVSAPAYLARVEQQAEKSVCCGFFKRSKVAVTVRMDKSGYCPGDTISMAAEFENGSLRSGRACLSLYQVQTYRANDRVKLTVLKISTASESAVKSRSTVSWSGRQLKIPNVPPSVGCCDILKVHYYAKVSLKMPGVRSSVEVILPVTLGAPAVPRWTRLRHMQLLPPPYTTTVTITASAAASAGQDAAPPPYYWSDGSQGQQAMAGHGHSHTAASSFPPSYDTVMYLDTLMP